MGLRSNSTKFGMPSPEKLQDVGHEAALPQQMLASRQVGQPGVALGPPGHIAIEMGADVLPLVSGYIGQCRLVNEKAQDVAGEPPGKRHDLRRA